MFPSNISKAWTLAAVSNSPMSARATSWDIHRSAPGTEPSADGVGAAGASDPAAVVAAGVGVVVAAAGDADADAGADAEVGADSEWLTTTYSEDAGEDAPATGEDTTSATGTSERASAWVSLP
eukprot:TRINITY_DN38425_c0_g1_i1.p4 TRINITY_DN38425_c0_g1~~TRINITY_DN38425_c0_g1_i1.p4  ORF type:complete len:123 (-),score=11.42 TRINITY_DN38425_c0_g1_i1:286-654(-)